MISDQALSSLRCNVYQPYWISWEDGFLRVGRQSYPSNEVVSYDIPDEQTYNINFIALATGPEATNGGLWELPEPSGERFFKENHSPGWYR